MTLDEIIDAVRTIAGDRDEVVQRYSNNEIAQVMSDARRSLAVRKIATFSDYAITTTLGEEAITPEPTDILGEILATATAVRILEQTYRMRVDSGTMGVSWSSGLEQESTINQEQAYRAMIAQVKADLTALIVINAAGTSALRMQ